MLQLPDPDALLTETEAAEFVGSLIKLRRRRRAGRIGAIVDGKTIMHSGQQIRDYIQACKTTVSPSLQTRCIGSASAQDPIIGTEPGLMPERAKLAACRLELPMKVQRTKRS